MRDEDVSKLHADLKLSRDVCALLWERGFRTARAAKAFLYPKKEDISPPFSLNGIREAAETVKKHIEDGDSIVVYGDYDCDGIGASAILYLTLRHLNARVACYIPVRAEDGYGLTLDSVQKVLQKHNPSLIITVDCGINSPDEVAFALRKGIDMIVTDHHTPEGIRPPCIVVNPMLQEGFDKLSGAGVALKLALALAPDFAEGLYDICALSTVADMVPLTGENRVIAKIGLEQLNRTMRAGIKALLTAADFRFDSLLTAHDVSYKIAPRLNASGRLSTAEKSLKLLIEEDTALLSLLAQELNLENETRQAIGDKIMDDALKMLENGNVGNKRILVLYNPSWEAGVVGIAASRLMHAFDRPVILLADGTDGALKGSGRSIPGVNLFDVLAACEPLLLRFGGHSAAAGLSLEPQNLAAFADAAEYHIRSRYSDETFVPVYRADLEKDVQTIDVSFTKEVALFEPFGQENPKPLFCTSGGALPFERSGSKGFIRWKVKRGVDMTAFQGSDDLPFLRSEVIKQLYYETERNVYNNVESARCLLKNMREICITPAEEELLCAYSRAFWVEKSGFFPLKAQKNIFAETALYSQKEPHSDATFSRLILCFAMDSFHKAREEYPLFQTCYAVLHTPNPVNTVCLAPVSYKNMAYYDQIDVWDTPPEAFINALSARFKGRVAVKNNPPCFPQKPALSPEKVRDVYVALRALHGKEIKEENMYLWLQKQGYKGAYLPFFLAYGVLKEIHLMDESDEGFIIVYNTKTELANSKLYNWLNEG